MWPRLARRGIPIVGQPIAISSLLQCGRVSLDAESTQTRLAKEAKVQLQCGRVPLDAESLARTCLGSADMSLQCGRVSLDAESPKRSRRRFSFIRFNVAASRSTRNLFAGNAVAVRCKTASMWPRLARRGIRT